MDLQAMSSSESAASVRFPYTRYYQRHYITQMRRRQEASLASRHNPRVRSQALRTGSPSATLFLLQRILTGSSGYLVPGGRDVSWAACLRAAPRPPWKESA